MGLREELPWLVGETVLAANQAAAGILVRELRERGVSVIELEGERIVSDESFFDAVRRGFAPGSTPVEDWEGVTRLVVQAGEELGPRVAVVWHRADASAHFSLRTVAEGVNALLAAAARVEPGARLELVLLGQTRDFPHPEPP